MTPDILSQWEKECEESIQHSKEICEANSGDELDWDEMCVEEQRILKLIAMIRHKDLALRRVIGNENLVSGFVVHALNLTKELK